MFLPLTGRRGFRDGEDLMKSRKFTNRSIIVWTSPPTEGRGDFVGICLINYGPISKRFVRILLLFSVLFFLPFCASKPDLIGRWKEVGKAATIEFSKDGAFKAVDNQGMVVSGKYTLLKDGRLRCEIQQKEGSAEVVNVTISIKGDELTLTSRDDTEVERYRRER
jgi:hypothetical protein